MTMKSSSMAALIKVQGLCVGEEELLIYSEHLLTLIELHDTNYFSLVILKVMFNVEEN